jgi:hypothetical protein
LMLVLPISHAKRDNTTNAQLENSFGLYTETQTDLVISTEYTKQDAHKLTHTTKTILTSTETVTFKILIKKSQQAKVEISLALRRAIILPVSRLKKKIVVMLESFLSAVLHGSEL